MGIGAADGSAYSPAPKASRVLVLFQPLRDFRATESNGYAIAYRQPTCVCSMTAFGKAGGISDDRHEAQCR